METDKNKTEDKKFSRFDYKNFKPMQEELIKLSADKIQMEKALQNILELPQTIGHAYQMQDIAKEALSKL